MQHRKAESGPRYKVNKSLLLLLLLWSTHTDFVVYEAAVTLAEAHPEFVVGVICQQRLSTHPNIIHVTPGWITGLIEKKKSAKNKAI